MKRAAVVVAVWAVVAVLTVTLTVMPPAAAQGGDTTQQTYIVQAGDNLFRIGLKFDLPPQAIAVANGITNPNLVFAGQRLIIPLPQVATATAVVVVTSTGSGTVATTAAATTTPRVVTVQPSTAGPSPTLSVVTPAPLPATYTVQPGENLYRISLRFGVPLQTLITLNNLPNANVIYVGQVLRILPPPPTPTPTATNTSVPSATLLASATPVVTNTNAAPLVVATFAASATPPATTTLAPLPAPLLIQPSVIAPSITPIPAQATSIPNQASNVGFNVGLDIELQGVEPAGIISRVQDLGIGWVKQRVYWKSLEAVKGQINFAVLDTQINALNAAGLKVMLTVSRAPEWARGTAVEDGPAQDNNDFAAFIGVVAARYKGKVNAYEVWEKPNVRREWNGKPISAASYVELLRVAYAAVKGADANAIVVSAGLAPTGFNDGLNAISDRLFLRQAYVSGLASYSDAIGAQPVGFANPPDAACCSAAPGVSGWFDDRSFYFKDTIVDYREIMNQNNDSGTFLWVTDFGWGSADGLVDPTGIDKLVGFVEFTDKTEQAQYTVRAIDLGRALSYIGPMFLSNLNTCQVSGTNTMSSDFTPCYYALLDLNGNPRPVYDAVKQARK